MRLRKEAGPDLCAQIDLAWRLALCRPPSQQESAEMSRFCAEEADGLLEDAAREGRALGQQDAEHAALEQLCRVIFNLNEFVYPE